MPDEQDQNDPVPLFGDAQELSEWGMEAQQMDPEFYRNGGVSLSSSELEALGEMRAKKVLVLTAGTGEDVASLANLGAEVTVIDDEESLQEPQALAAAAQISANFVIGDSRVLPESFRTGNYDAVYSGFGSIDWVNDLTAWAAGIEASLRQGGRLVVYDEHPFSHVFDEEDGQLIPANSYFGQTMEAILESGFDTLVEDDDGTIEAASTDARDFEQFDVDDDDLDEPDWTLGDLITALGNNGLATLSLLEFPESDRFETAMDCLETVDPLERDRIPSALLLVAVKL